MNCSVTSTDLIVYFTIQTYCELRNPLISPPAFQLIQMPLFTHPIRHQYIFFLQYTPLQLKCTTTIIFIAKKRSIFSHRFKCSFELVSPFFRTPLLLSPLIYCNRNHYFQSIKNRLSFFFVTLSLPFSNDFLEIISDDLFKRRIRFF